MVRPFLECVVNREKLGDCKENNEEFAHYKKLRANVPIPLFSC